ncbi:M57 family metalloprotease [Archangium violaceum]|uniref:M57 family metalloprotease n=1 Tax=Archangium violaceum TaxID=83451 RepID=UPI0036D8EADA
MFKRTAILVVSGAVLAGCGAGPEAESQEVVSNLLEAGFPAGDIQVHDGQVFVGNDAHVTLEASRELLQPGEGSKEHHRTTNLVSTSVTRICINPTSTFNSYSRLIQGLDMAIQNYNVLGLRITFVRGPTAGCSANITAQTMSGAGGSSGFPSGGMPYGTINIGTGLQSYSVDLSEHVITHELGHAIGIRHTDYYNRLSCGGIGTNEGTAGVGAILIPGTPSSDPDSLFNACFSSTASGEFSQYDVIALNYLY